MDDETIIHDVVHELSNTGKKTNKTNMVVGHPSEKELDIVYRDVSLSTSGGKSDWPKYSDPIKQREL